MPTVTSVDLMKTVAGRPTSIVPGNWLRVDNRMAAPFRHQSTGMDSFEQCRFVMVSRLTVLGVPFGLHRHQREHRQQHPGAAVA